MIWDITCYMNEDFAVLASNDGEDPKHVSFNMVRVEGTVLVFYDVDDKPITMVPLCNIRVVDYTKSIE